MVHAIAWAIACAWLACWISPAAAGQGVLHLRNASYAQGPAFALTSGSYTFEGMWCTDKLKSLDTRDLSCTDCCTALAQRCHSTPLTLLFHLAAAILPLLPPAYVVSYDPFPSSTILHIGSFAQNYASISLTEGNRIQYCVHNSPAPQETCLTSSTSLVQGLWTHVAVSTSATMTALLVDGAVRGQAVMPVPADVVRSDIWLGARAGVAMTTWPGLIDEVRIWSIARAEIAIAANMDENPLLTVSPSELAALELRWAMDSAAAQTPAGAGTMVDTSGHGRDGTVHCALPAYVCRTELPDGVYRAVCGDGKISPGEECDTGLNMTAYDAGCHLCKVQPGWLCWQVAPGLMSMCAEASSHASVGFDNFTTPLAEDGWGVRGSVQKSAVARRTGPGGLLMQAPAVRSDATLPAADALYMHLRADEGVASSSGRVTAWSDLRSGNGWQMTPPAGRVGPALRANGGPSAGSPSLRFDMLQSGSDVALTFTSDAMQIQQPFTAVLVWKFYMVGQGRLLVSRDGKNVVFGPYDKYSGLYGYPAGWANDGMSISNDLAVHDLWYSHVGLLEPGMAKLRRSGVFVAQAAGSQPSWGRVGLGFVPDGTSSSRCPVDVAAFMVFNRTLTDAEVEDLEMYLAHEFDLPVGPVVQAMRRSATTAGLTGVTMASRVLGGPVTDSTLVRAAVAVAKKPSRMGLPVAIMLFEVPPGGAVIDPTQCTRALGGDQTCSGYRFVSICYSGNADLVHCDETRGTGAPGEWQLMQVRVNTLFHRKYQVSPDAAAEFSASSVLQLVAVSAGADEPAEVWLDDIEMYTLASETRCETVAVASVGTATYDAMLLLDTPALYWRLDGSGTDIAAGVAGAQNYPGATGASQSSLVHWQGSPNAARAWCPGTTAVTASSRFSGVQKFHPQRGFGLEFWARWDAPPAPGAGLPLLRDGSSPTVRIDLQSDLRLFVSVRASAGTVTLTSASPLASGVAHHIGLTWSATSGLVRLYVDGADSGANYNPAHGLAPGNSPYSTSSDPVISLGYNIGQACANLVTFDEFAWYLQELPSDIFRARWEAYGLNPSAVPEIAGLSSPGAQLVRGGAVVDSVTLPGLHVWLLNDDGSPAGAAQTFNVFQYGTPVATAVSNSETQIAAARNWLLSDANVPVGASVAIALSWPAAPVPMVLYEQTFRTPLINRLHNSRVAYKDNIEMNVDMLTDWPAVYPRTWQGARDYCQDRGADLCSLDQLCHDPYFDANSLNLIPVVGTYAGDAWAPYLGTNNWVSLSRAYPTRQCFTYSQVASKEGWSPTSPPWNNPSTPAGSDSRVVCCQPRSHVQGWTLADHTPSRAGFSSDAVDGRRYHNENTIDRRFRIWGSGVQSLTYYGARRYCTGNSYWYRQSTPRCAKDHWWNDDINGRQSQCTGRLFGQIALLSGLPEAFSWKDYTVEAEVDSGINQFGIMWYYQNEGTYYQYTFDTSLSGQEACHGLIKFKGASRDRMESEEPTNLQYWKTSADANDFVTQPWRQDQTNTLRVETRNVGSGDVRIRVFMNDVLMRDFTDTSGLTGGGTIGFMANYNPRATFTNIKVTQHFPDIGPLNDVLHAFGAPPLPNTRVGTVSSAKHRVGVGSSYAALGLKTRSGSVLSGVRSPAGTAFRGAYVAQSNSTNRPQGVDAPPAGALPAARTYAGEGPAVARGVFGCRAVTVSVPENTPAGAVIPIPLPLPAPAQANPRSFRVVGAEGVTRDHIDDGDFGALSISADAAFSVSPDDGLLVINKPNAVDYETKPTIDVALSALTRPEYDSGWFGMASVSDVPDLEFRELPLPPAHAWRMASTDVALLEAVGYARILDGPNKGMLFFIGGTPAWGGDSDWWARWGGGVLAYNADGLRVWMPSRGRYARGSAVMLAGGVGTEYDELGGFVRERNAQISHNVEARVVLREVASPEFDSGWFDAAAQQGHASSYSVYHGVLGIPRRVRVLVRAMDGPNAGYIFEARGDAQRGRRYGNYGGVVYGYDSRSVRILLPDGRQSSPYSQRGFAVYVPEGFGPSTRQQRSFRAAIRVQVWSANERSLPDWRTDPAPGVFRYREQAYSELAIAPHRRTPPSELPGKLNLFARLNTGTPYSRYPLPSMHGNQQWIYWCTLSGVVPLFNATDIRLFAAGRDFMNPDSGGFNAKPAAATDGWGGEFNTFAFNYVTVQGEFWQQPDGAADAQRVTLAVTNLAEPPSVPPSYFELAEPTVPAQYPAYQGKVVGTIPTVDGENSALRYTFLAGNDGPEGQPVFAVDSQGVVTVACPECLNFELVSHYTMTVTVQDDTFAAVALIEVEILDRNDPVTAAPAILSIPENSPINTLAEANSSALPYSFVRSFDEDIFQSKYYSIIGGNIGPFGKPAFSINPCTGQVRVNNTQELDFETLDWFNLTILVQDDGVPNITEDTTWAYIVVTDRNDPPTLGTQAMTIPENSLGGDIVLGPLPAFDQDNDTLWFDVLTAPAELFTVVVTGLDAMTQHPTYALQLNPDVAISYGDGSGRDNIALPPANYSGGLYVLDYEEDGGSLRTYSVRVTVRDQEVVTVDPRNHKGEGNYVVDITDANDAPDMDPDFTLVVNENSPHGTQVGSIWLGFTDEDAADPSLSAVISSPASDAPFSLFPNGTLYVDLTTGAASLINYELNASWPIQITVTDTGGPLGAGYERSFTSWMRVRVNDLPEPPVLPSALSFSVSENAEIGFTVGIIGGYDEDPDDVVRYEAVSGDVSLISVLPGEGTIRLVNKLDYETQTSHTIVVQGIDLADTRSGTCTITITVIDEDDPPFWTCSGSGTAYVLYSNTSAMEEVMTGLNVPQIKPGFDAQAVDLASGLPIATPAACEALCATSSDLNPCAAFTHFPDHPSYPPAWRQTCWGRDASSTSLKTDDAVFVGATSGIRVDLCETMSLDENTPSALLTPYIPVNDAEGAVVAVQAMQPASVTGTVFQAQNQGSINSQGLAVLSPLNYEEYAVHVVRMVAWDNAGGNSSAWVRVNVNDLEEAPMWASSGRPALTAAEALPAGYRVGPPLIEWIHDDDGDNLTFLISGYNVTNPALQDQWYMEPLTGQMRCNRSVGLTVADTDPVWLVTFTVLDGVYSVDFDVVLRVFPRNDPPVIDNTSLVFDLPEHGPPGTGTTPAGPVGSDADMDTIRWSLISTKSWDGTPVPLFDIDPVTGALTTRPGIARQWQNFECERVGDTQAPACATVPRTYSLLVQLQDWGSGNLTTRDTLTVRITNIPEALQAPASVKLRMNEHPHGTVPGSLIQRALAKDAVPLGEGSIEDFFDEDRTRVNFSIPDPAMAAIFSVTSGRAPDVITGILVYTDSNITYPPGQVPLITAAAGIDYETRQVYVFDLLATADETTRVVNVTVYVDDVAEPPEIVPYAPVWNLNETFTTGHLLGEFIIQDPDGEAVVFDIAEVHEQSPAGAWSPMQFAAAVFRLEPGISPPIVPLSDQVVQLRLAPSPADGSPVVDFERAIGYWVRMRACDPRQCSFWNLNVSIVDMNDVSVSAVRVVSNDGTLPTTGGIVEIDGANLGPLTPDGEPLPTYVLNYGCDATGAACRYSSSDCNVTTPGSALRCAAPPGSGANHRVRLDVWKAGASSPQQHVVQALQAFPYDISYTPPTVSALALAAAELVPSGAPMGSAMLIGENFGMPQPATAVLSSAMLRFTSACNVLNHTHAECATPPGAGGGLVWTLRVDGQESPANPAVASSFPAPAISNMTLDAPWDAAVTAGGNVLVVQGSAFGPGMSLLYAARKKDTIVDMRGFAVIARVNNSDDLAHDVLCNVAVPFTRVTCTLPAGVGVGFTWSLCVARQCSAPGAQPVSYAQPVIDSISDEGAYRSQTSGGGRITLRGSSFGPAGWIRTMYTVAPDGAVTMTAVPGAGSPPGAANMVQWIRYAVDQPGSRQMQATDCAVEIPHAEITCLSGVGTGRGHTWQARVGHQSTPPFVPPVNTSYAPPYVTRVAMRVNGTLVNDASPTAGGRSVFIYGNNFGPDVSTLELVRLHGLLGGDESRPVSYDLTASCVTEELHTVLRCVMPEGAGAGLSLQLRVDGLISELVTTTYKPPVIHSVAVEAGQNVTRSTLNTRGGDAVVIRGEQLGPGIEWVDSLTYAAGSARFSSAGAKLERTLTTARGLDGPVCTMTVPHMELRCYTAAGYGAGLSWSIMTGTQLSLLSTDTTSYAPPVLHDILIERAAWVPPSRAALWSTVPAPVVHTSLAELPTTAVQLRLVGEQLAAEVRSEGSALRVWLQRADEARDGSGGGVFGSRFGPTRASEPASVVATQDCMAGADPAAGILAAYDWAPYATVYAAVTGGQSPTWTDVGGEVLPVPAADRPNTEPYCVDILLPGGLHGSWELVVDVLGRRSSMPLATADPLLGVVSPLSDAFTLGAWWFNATYLRPGGPSYRASASAALKTAFAQSSPAHWRILVLEGLDFGANGTVMVQPIIGNASAADMPDLFTDYATTLSPVSNSPYELVTAAITTPNAPLIPCLTDVTIDLVAYRADNGLFPAEQDAAFGFQNEAGLVQCLLPPMMNGMGQPQAVQAGRAMVISHIESSSTAGVWKFSNAIDFELLAPTIMDQGDAPDPTGWPTHGSTGALQVLVSNMPTGLDRGRVNVTVGGLPCPLLPQPDGYTTIDQSRVPNVNTLTLEDAARFLCPSGSVCGPSGQAIALIQCRVPVGEGLHNAVQVYSDGVGSPATASQWNVKYQPPVLPLGIAAFSLPGSPAEWLTYGVPTAGGIAVRVLGSNFGLNPQVSVAGQPVSVTYNPVVGGAVQFTLPAGVGRSLCVSVSAGGQSAPDNCDIDYAPPFIRTVVGALDLPTRGTDAAHPVWIVGRNFGPESSDGNGTRRALAASYEARALLAGEYLDTVAWNDTHIAFTAPESIGGAGLYLEVHVAGRTSAEHWQETSFALPPPAGRVSYSPPTIDSIAPLSGPQASMFANGTRVVVRVSGSNFGVQPTVTFGGVVLPPSAVLSSSHESVEFMAPPGQGSASVVVNASNQGTAISAVRTFHFDMPVVSPLRAPDAEWPVIPCAWQDVAYLPGSIGETDDAVKNRIRSGPWCRSTPTTITLVGSNLGVHTQDALHVRVRIDSDMVALPCERAELLAAIEVSGTVAGLAAGMNPIMPCIELVPVAAATADSVRHYSSLEMRIPAGHGATAGWNATLGMTMPHELRVETEALHDGQGTGIWQSSAPIQFSYAPPDVLNVARGGTALYPSPLWATGGSTLLLIGHNLGYNGDVLDAQTAAGLWRSSVNVTLSGEACHELSWQSPRDPLPEVGDELTGSARLAAQSMLASPPLNGLPYLACQLGRIRVGDKSISVGVADAETSISAELADVKAVCPPKNWGEPGEYCLDCPEGAECENCPLPNWECLNCPEGPDGTEECAQCRFSGPWCANAARPYVAGGEPVSIAGFYVEGIANTTGDYYVDAVCPPERRTRAVCPMVVACSPKESCVGNNTCGIGYDGIRCASCIKGKFQRVNGKCQPCPTNVWLPVAGMLVFLLVLFWGSNFLNKNNVRLTLMAVLLDWGQAVAIFAQSDVRWPTELLDLFQFMKLLSFDISFTAPDCLAPNVDYSIKWYIQLGLPAIAAVAMFVWYWSFWIWKKFVRKQSGDKLGEHADTAVATLVMAGYALYILVARRSLDPFNCNPTTPPDPRGTLYMQATNTPCWVVDSLQMKLLPIAIIVLLGYVVAYPVMVGMFIHNNREMVKLDLYLRSVGANFADGNGGASDGSDSFRKRYSRLWYMNRPGHELYTCAILLRKLLLACIALMFRGNAAYQMSLALLVMFISYAVQTRVKPYLCAANAPKVIAYHNRQVELGSRLHMVLDVRIRAALAAKAARARKMKEMAVKAMWEHREAESAGAAADGAENPVKPGKGRKGKKAAKSGGGAAAASATLVGRLQEVEAEREAIAAGSPLVDYNNVDAFMLGSAAAICLLGLMFESNAAASENSYKFDSGTELSLTIMTMLVIIFSFIFWGVSFGIDVAAHLRPGQCCVGLERSKRTHGSLHKAAIKMLWTDRRRAAKAKKEKQKLKFQAALTRAEIEAASANRAPEGMVVNPLMASRSMASSSGQAAAAANSAAKGDLRDEDFSSERMPETVPANVIWQAYVQHYKRMLKRNREMNARVKI